MDGEGETEAEGEENDERSIDNFILWFLHSGWFSDLCGRNQKSGKWRDRVRVRRATWNPFVAPERRLDFDVKNK